MKYFVGKLSRTQADNLLATKEKGSFLIRQSDINFQLRIVINYPPVTHILIGHTNLTYFLDHCDLRDIEFQKLDDIIIALKLNKRLGISMNMMSNNNSNNNTINCLEPNISELKQDNS